MVDGGVVSVQGLFAVVMAVVAVVVTAIAVVIVFRRMTAERERPAVLAAMTPGQRRRAMRQIRKAQPVADDELVGVRAVAVQAADQRGLALLFAGTTVLFAAQAIFPLFPPVLRVIDAVAAAAQAFAALAFLHTSGRARRFLRAHPGQPEQGGASR